MNRRVVMFLIIAAAGLGVIGLHALSRHPRAYEMWPTEGRSATNMRGLLLGLTTYGTEYKSLPMPGERWQELITRPRLGLYPSPQMFQHPNVPPDQPAYFYSPSWSQGVVFFENPLVRRDIGGGGLKIQANGVVVFLPEAEYRELIAKIPDAKPCRPARDSP